MSDKIQPQHLRRKAVLYVRQSSGYQVAHNLESQRLQYGMEQRLRSLGWQEIEIIDEDLGRSADGDTHRAPASSGWSPTSVWGRWRGGGPRGVAVRTQQPRVAAAHRGLPCRGHLAGGPGHGLLRPVRATIVYCLV